MGDLRVSRRGGRCGRSGLQARWRDIGGSRGEHARLNLGGSEQNPIRDRNRGGLRLAHGVQFGAEQGDLFGERAHLLLEGFDARFTGRD